MKVVKIMNKTILIAGCCGVTGKAAARRFHDEGWYVIGLDVKLNENEDKYVDTYVPCNLRDMEGVEKTIASIEEKFELDAVFNGAGAEAGTGFEDTDSKVWDVLLDTILGGNVNLCRAAAPCMKDRKRGKIIILASDYRDAEGDNVLSAAAYGTLHGFVKSFGMEMAADNVLVNVISPAVPFDADLVADTVFYLADKDTYTAAQVVSVSGA